MFKTFKPYLYIISYLCLSHSLQAEAADPVNLNFSIEISAKSLNFNYEEFNETGESFNKETGYIPGLSISIFKTRNKFTNSIVLEAYDGQVDYDGQTQSGFPLNTQTDETLYRLFYKLNWSPSEDNNSIYTKVAWHQWDRQILPTNISSGLFEQYQWWAIEVGFLVSLYEQGANSWLFEAGASKITNGTISIDLEKQGFGTPTLNLGNGAGFTSALKYRYTLNKQSTLGFTMDYHYWTFGRSSSETISNGFATINIAEPHSISRHSSIAIDYSHHF